MFDFKNLHFGKLTIATVAGLLLPLISAAAAGHPITAQIVIQSIATGALGGVALVTKGVATPGYIAS